MKRYLCWLALVVVIAAPAAAAACWPMWGRPAYFGRPFHPAPYYCPPPPLCAPPVFAAPPMVVAPAIYPPASQQHQPQQQLQHQLPPPRIESIPKSAPPSAAPAPGSDMGRVPEPMPPLAKPSAAPPPESVRPAGGKTTGSDAPPAKDTPAAAKPVETPRDPELSYPKVEIPKNLRNDSKLPPLELPKEPDLSAVPKVPAVGAPKESVIPAIPSPAPPADSLIPKLPVPLGADAGKRETLPSLTLPPEVPVAPEKNSTSRSSPLSTGSMTVSVFPARSTEAALPGYRSVGFFNHTARDLALTIEGRAVKLPARSYLQAQLAPSFTWSHGNRAGTREVVPEGAGGLDVVFRE